MFEFTPENSMYAYESVVWGVRNDVANKPNSLVERGTVTAAECERGQWERKDSEIARIFSERTSWMRVSSLVAVDLGGITVL